jgi:GNAT superfamily N-acetyltransferase
MVEIRPMAAADIDAAVEMIIRGDWGDRRAFFEFAISHAESRPIVAVDDGEIVGTGVGTINGPVGWVGAIFVDEHVRRRGIGRGLTDRILQDLDAAGCVTQLLVASTEGRPMYERIGFELQTEYVLLQAPGTAAAAGSNGSPAGRPFEPADLAVMGALDRAATGEERAHLLAAFASRDSTRIVTSVTGDVDGFVIRAPWGGGATIVASNDAGVAIQELRRAERTPDKIVRASLPAENLAGVARLEALGWIPAWRAPRLIRGAPMNWRPDQVWGQFNMAMG